VSTHSPLIEITLNQDEIDRLSLNADVHTDGPYEQLLDDITRVELHDGFIRYLGTKVQPDRADVDGSFNVSLEAENDVLKARIVAVNIPGIGLNDHRVVESNRELEYELTHVVIHSQ